MRHTMCRLLSRLGRDFLIVTCLWTIPTTHAAEQPNAPAAVLVKGFSFSGNTVISQAELEALTQPYVEQALTLPDLERIGAAVADLYKQRGYTLASAYIPQQRIQFGMVEISVLEGRLGDISVSGNRFYSTEFIRSGFAGVMEARVIRNTDLERALLLLNDYPDLKVSAALEPGEFTGSTNVQASVEDKRPIHATLDYNNYGFNNISRNRFGAGIEVGNALREGAILTFNGIVGDHPERLQFITGGYALPVGVHGTKVVLSGSTGRFDVGAELAALKIRGKIHTYDLSITHPVVKTRWQGDLVERPSSTGPPLPASISL